MIDNWYCIPSADAQADDHFSDHVVGIEIDQLSVVTNLVQSYVYTGTAVIFCLAVTWVSLSRVDLEVPCVN